MNCPRTRCALLACSLLATLLFLTSIARAQDDPGRENILRGLRDALSFRSPAEAYLAALAVPTAEDALSAMKNLAENQSDPETAAKAAVWIGLYYYGAGASRDALTWFELGLKGGAHDEARDRARFWAEQCRSVLEVEGTGEATTRGSANSIPAVLAALAVGDQELRHGKANPALRAYLAEEGSAARLGCLGPVYYRIALVLSTSPALGQDLGLTLESIEAWEKRTASSPERALAATFMAGNAEPVVAPPDSTQEGAAPTPEEDDDEAPATAAPVESTAKATPGEVDGTFAVQLGAYRDRARAREEMERLTLRGLSVRLDRESDEGGDWYRIRLGRESSRAAAAALAERVCQGLDYSVVRLTGPRGAP